MYLVTSESRRVSTRIIHLSSIYVADRFLIAAQKETGNCYCVNLQRDAPWKVVAQLRARGRLADVVLYDDEARGSLKVLVLHVEYEPFSSVGQQLLVYDMSYLIDAGQRLVNEVTNIVELPAFFYELCHAPGDPRLLIGSPYLTRQLHTLKLRRGFEDATLSDTVLTGHHVRLARVFANRRWIVTCAYDGLVVIRDRTIRQIIVAMPIHHRLNSGSRKAIVNSDGDMIVALGHDGSLIATRVRRESKKVLTISCDLLFSLKVFVFLFYAILLHEMVTILVFSTEE